jgi:hypothetical protein
MRHVFTLTFRRVAAARTRRFNARGSLPTIWTRGFMGASPGEAQAGCPPTHDRSVALAQAGFKVSGLERLARARAQRRLGELAEARGDVRAARRHYQLALAASRHVGVLRRLRRLERENRDSP